MTLQFTAWNAERLLAKVKPALEATGQALGEEAKRQLAEVKYDWPNPTLRFTSLNMGGTPGGRQGNRFSPPTTAAGARNTKGFKQGVQKGSFFGRGVRIEAGPRDIIDTGTLLRSQTEPQTQLTEAGAELTIAWNAPYSGVVLRGGDYGEYVNPDGQLVNVGNKPGRDWITPTLRTVPVAKLFADAWKQAGSRA